MLSQAEAVVHDAAHNRALYSGHLVRTYDRSISHWFGRLKGKAIAASSLRAGGRVLVACCGTGLDFVAILDRIGDAGQIVGVDLSGPMLARARARVQSNRWRNVTLHEADITASLRQVGGEFDAVVCTLGLSIIADAEAAYDNLHRCVRSGGELVVGDMQLARGWRAIFNPLTVSVSRRFGGSTRGHAASRQIRERMEAELVDVRGREALWGAYFFRVGRVP